MEDSIFTKIIKGDVPAHKIYEDEHTIAFLDIHPAKPGHTLVVPKEQTDHIWDLTEEAYQAVMVTCRKAATRRLTGKAHRRANRGFRCTACPRASDSG
jgi:histidine triad (HIT) family protein